MDLVSVSWTIRHCMSGDISTASVLENDAFVIIHHVSWNIRSMLYFCTSSCRCRYSSSLLLWGTFASFKCARVIALPLAFCDGHFGSLQRLHLIRDCMSGHGFPPGSAFCRIVRERNRPPLWHDPRHPLQDDQGESLQFAGLGGLTVGLTVTKRKKN